MKILNYKSLLSFFFLWISLCGFSQSNYGTIEYEIRVNLNKRFPVVNSPQGGRAKGVQNTTPSYLVEKAKLYFNDKTSVFITETVPDVNDQRKTFETNTKMNFVDKTIETQISILGETYLIKDSLPKRTWKFTNRVRNIAGIDCKQAITKINDSTTIYAWFNPHVLPSVGPESYWDLPGAIMGLAYEDGSITYFATNFSTEFMDVNEKYTNSKAKKWTTRSAFINDFSNKYKTTDRWYRLIKDLLHFF